MKLQSTLSSPVLPHSNGFRVTIDGQSKHQTQTQQSETPVQASVLNTKQYGGEMMLSTPNLAFHARTAYT